MKYNNTIEFVSLGPGDPELITLKDYESYRKQTLFSVLPHKKEMRLKPQTLFVR